MIRNRYFNLGSSETVLSLKLQFKTKAFKLKHATVTKNDPWHYPHPPSRSAVYLELILINI
jgi:hypothetical protein